MPTTLPAKIASPLTPGERDIARQMSVSHRASQALHFQLDRLAEMALRPDAGEHTEMLSRNAARLGSALARLQEAQAAGALALARLRHGGVVQRILVEYRNRPRTRGR